MVRGLIIALVLNLLLWGVALVVFLSWLESREGLMQILIGVWALSIVFLAILFYWDWRGHE